VGHCHAGVLLSAKAGPTTCSDDPVLEAESVDLTSDEHAVSAAFMSPCGGDIESNSALEVTVAEGRRDVSSRQLRLLVRSADNRAWRAGPTLLEGLVGVEGVEVAAAHRPTISRICSARALSTNRAEVGASRIVQRVDSGLARLTLGVADGMNTGHTTRRTADCRAHNLAARVRLRPTAASGRPPRGWNSRAVGAVRH
jgi:hypothetical protein